MFIQILFTTIFVYAFINIYKPFSVENWYHVDIWRFRFYSLLIVLSGMLVVIISRIVLYQISRYQRIGVFLYGLFIALEILLMSIFYALMAYFVPEDNTHSFISLVFLSIYNTVLILLIPYLLTLLYFSWEENRINLESMKTDLQYPLPQTKNGFIAFHDEKGNLRITLKRNDVYYIAASDNYVVIHYMMNGEEKHFLLRNTLKNLEEALSPFNILRCHRSYMVNTDKINAITKAKKGLLLHLGSVSTPSIQVSQTYSERFTNLHIQ